MATNEKNILLVDDEEPLLFTFQTSLVNYSPDLKVYTAGNGVEAIRVLESHRVDVVVTDLKMPEMDGFQLLLHMKRFYPEIPVIVTTGIGTPEVVDWLKSLGTLRYLEKPVNIKDLAVNIFKCLSATSEGKIQGVTLAGFLQLVVMEEKSCALRVRAKDRNGVLYLRNGELVDAKTRDLEGEAAAHEIVAWDGAEIEMGPYTSDDPRKIESRLSEILLEAFRRKDEGDRDAPAGGAATDLDSEPDLENIIRLEPLQEEGGGPAGAIGRAEPAPAPDGGDRDGARRGGAVIGLAERMGNVLPLHKEKRMANLREVLSELSRLQGVNAVCLVGCDGFLIDSISNTRIDADLVGAIASSGFGASESIGRELSRGVLEGTMLEFGQGPVIIAPVGKDMLLVVVAGKDASLGMLRLKIKKLATEIVSAAEAI